MMARAFPLLLGIGLLCEVSGDDKGTPSVHLQRSCALRMRILTCDPNERLFSWTFKRQKSQCVNNEGICTQKTCYCDLPSIQMGFMYSPNDAKKLCYDQIRSQTCHPETQPFTATNTTLTMTCSNENTCDQEICECIKNVGLLGILFREKSWRCYAKTCTDDKPTINVKVRMSCGDENVCARGTCECFQSIMKDLNLKLPKLPA